MLRQEEITNTFLTVSTKGYYANLLYTSIKSYQI